MSRVTKELFATPGGDGIDARASLEGEDLEAVYWEYHGIKDEIARKERFWASTNHALEDAYKELAQRTEELRIAQGRIVELEKQRTEQLMAGGFAHEVRNALAGARILVDRGLREQGKAEAVSLCRQNARDLREVATLLKQHITPELHGQVITPLRQVFQREEALEEILTGTEKAVLRGLDLASMLLEYTKTGSADAADLDRVSLFDVCSGVIVANRPRAQEQRVAIQLEGNAQEGIVLGDATKLYSAVENLLLNALDAHSEHQVAQPTIRLTLTGQAGRVQLRVLDNATGVPPHLTERIFEPFFSTKPNTGTGLGLPFAARIVSGFGGKLSLEAEAKPTDLQSQNVTGACFLIDLPAVESSVKEAHL